MQRKELPHNYCIVCHKKPRLHTEYCKRHTGQGALYCSYCGVTLNRYLDLPLQDSRTLCLGCNFAFAFPHDIKSNTRTKPFLCAMLQKNSILPIHVQQAYRLQLQSIA